MDLNEYQSQAALTDQTPLGVGQDEKAFVVPLLGLSGEVGSLHSEYKKHLRDGDAYKLFKAKLAEEIGDILWYLANIATKFRLNLNDIAKNNLRKTQERWPSDESGQTNLLPEWELFDRDFVPEEQLPRELRVEFRERLENGKPKIDIFINGKHFGNTLSDNYYEDDGYRYHDIFHVSYAAMLGWSSVLRRFLKCKRRSDPEIDEVEDGGRARVIEEGVTAYIYERADAHGYYEYVEAVDFDLLKTVKEMTSRLEVSRRTFGDWEKAILEGYRVFRLLRKHKGGVVLANLITRKLDFSPGLSDGTGP